MSNSTVKSRLKAPKGLTKAFYKSKLNQITTYIRKSPITKGIQQFFALLK